MGYKQLSGFDSFELTCITYDGKEYASRDCMFYKKWCEQNNPEIEHWSISGHIPDNGMERIADCYTKEVAELLCNALAEKFRVEIHKYYQ